jgi:natural product precursor
MKKLQLNKEVIANLTSDNMNQVVGGNCTCAGCEVLKTADGCAIIKTVDACKVSVGCEVLSAGCEGLSRPCVVETYTCNVITEVCYHTNRCVDA